MLTQKLTRNGITYDITSEKIGTNKARAESFPTWKTKGSVYTKKIDQNGIYWGATFNVPPMAADASLNSILNTENELSYNIKEDESEITIPINFGAIITNMSEFVGETDIREIKAELRINDQVVEIISDKEKIHIEDSYNLKINKTSYTKGSTIEISVKCNTIAETYFTNDIPMSDSKEIILLVSIEGVEDKNVVKDVNKRFESGDKPKIASIEIKRITTNEAGKEILTNLYTAKKTNTKFICAGQVLYVRVKTLNDTASVTLEIEGDRSITNFDELTKKFEWDEVKERGLQSRFKTLNELKKQYQMPYRLSLEKDEKDGVKYFSAIYIIPYKTKQTLNSWATLRENNKNAFQINNNQLFTRITLPYSLVFKASSEIGITTKRIDLDVFESWNTIYNRDLTSYIK